MLSSNHIVAVLVLYIAVRGDFILVGDLMRSISLLSYSSVEVRVPRTVVCLNKGAHGDYRTQFKRSRATITRIG